MNDRSSFPIKIVRLLRDGATSHDCGDGIYNVVEQGNLLLSDAILLWRTSAKGWENGDREKRLSEESRKWFILSVHSPVWH